MNMKPGQDRSPRWILTCTSGMGLVKRETARMMMREMTKRMMAKYK